MARVRVDPALTVDEFVVREFTDGDRAQLAAWVSEDPTRGDADALGIFCDEQLVGGIALHDRNEPTDVELGYWLIPEWQGQGIATRITQAMTDFVFRIPTVERVLIQHRPDNLRSQRVPERLGFRRIDRESTCPCGEGEHIVWAVTRHEWLPCN